MGIVVSALDGSSSFEIVGASPFPRHWFYDSDGVLLRKSGVIDFATWAAEHTVERSPWHDVDRPPDVSDVESATEREISLRVMGSRKPKLRRYRPGDELMRQGEPGDEVLLVLDGIAEVSVDGDVVAEVGPGSILGERAVLEEGVRTSTVTARTPMRAAVARRETLDPESMAKVADTHRRERG